MSRATRNRVGRTGCRFEVRDRRRHQRRSAAYHFRPLLEVLEQRRLLTTVTGVVPLPNTHEAPVTTDISVTCDTNINPATVSPDSFAVHGMQTGQILQSLSVSGDTITLSPAAPFHPGELVQATATSGIENLAGEPLAAPFVWQFRTAASGGTGLFSDSGQSLGAGRAVALGDLDGDGDLDAFVGNWGEPNTVWVNDGSGNFSDSGQSLGDYSPAVALGDVDGDGDLDAFVGNASGINSPPAPNKVWLNDGGGNFSDSGQSLGAGRAALGDVDGDGDLDVFVQNPGSNKLWLNDGSGSFSDSGQNLSGALGDLDGDGDLDAFAGNRGGNKVWLNDGSGSFSDNGQNVAAGQASLGDLDGDGDLDAFVGSYSYSHSIRISESQAWLNDGLGNFSAGQRLDGGRAVALGDVDGDGDLDAFAGDRGGNKVWLNDGGGNFSDSGLSLGGGTAVALGDVDGDGDLDVFVAHEGQDNKVWLNQDATVDGDFNDDGVYDCADINALVFEIAAGTNNTNFDLTGDGLVDLSDRDAWLAEAGEINLGPGKAYLLGDATLDGIVDGLDFIEWSDNKFTSVAEWCAGDFTADGIVDGLDFVEWNTNKFQSSDGAAEIMLPEPRRDVHEIDETNHVQVNEDTILGPTIVAPPLAPPAAKRIDSVFAALHRREEQSDGRPRGATFENLDDALPVNPWVF